MAYNHFLWQKHVKVNRISPFPAKLAPRCHSNRQRKLYKTCSCTGRHDKHQVRHGQPSQRKHVVCRLWLVVSTHEARRHQKTVRFLCVQHSLVLAHKLLVKVLEICKHCLEFLKRGQNGGPEMIGAWHLAKAASWYNTYAAVFKELHHIEEIWCLSSSLGCFDCFWWQCELRKCIHRSSHPVTAKSFNRVECVGNKLGPLLQGIQHRCFFLHKKVIWRFTGLRRVDNTIHGTLS